MRSADLTGQIVHSYNCGMSTTEIRTIDDVFSIWDTVASLARDIGESYDQVLKWRQRRRIPAEHWTRVASAASVRGRDLTVDQLARIRRDGKRKRRAA